MASILSSDGMSVNETMYYSIKKLKEALKSKVIGVKGNKQYLSSRLVKFIDNKG